MVTPKVAPGTPVPQDGAPTAAAPQTSDHLVSVARSMVEKSVDGKEAKTQAAARAEHELERIEHQIGQLESAAGDNQTWVNRLYDSAFRQATEDERALALVYLKRWLETRRE